MSVTLRGALCTGLSLLVGFAAIAGAPAQGPFVNFELPSVEPIAVAKVGSAWYVLVCNGADNAVEIFRASDNSHVLRVPVGQHPVTVRWSSRSQAFFTCNFLGDSVTKVKLQTSGASITANIEATRYVGDEPADLVIVDNGSKALVTLNSSSSLQRISTTTLLPDAGWPKLLIDDPLATQQRALKEPRRMSIDPITGTVAVLGTRGGIEASDYQLNLLRLTISGSSMTAVAQGGLGTSAFGMEHSSDGRLWVVGNKAQIQLQGEPALSSPITAPTGFVQSQLAVLDPPGTVSSTPQVRNLNLVGGSPVGVADAIAMPTDVAVYEEGGVVKRAFISSFLSDRVAVLEVPPGLPTTLIANWTMSQMIDLRPIATGAYRNVGPRAFALKAADPTIPGDVAKLYVANTLRPSFTVLDPATPSATPVTVLLNDPTPDFIRTGRMGLYDARLSGKGFVACASCHFDGGTDGLAWRLEVVSPPSPPVIPAGLLLDGVNAANLVPSGQFPFNKGRMVTQNLHGLVNHPVPGRAQDLYTNKPYHWRGDRADFLAFNGAFVGLLGATNPLSEPDMEAYRDFINSCVYPPNPEQPLDRRYVDVPGVPNARAGQILFHTRDLGAGAKFASRSCVHCHSGAAGSNNRITELQATDPDLPTNALQPIETAALRSLRSREALVETGFGVLAPSILTGEFGLLHVGRAAERSINLFHTAFGLSASERESIVEFVRKFDAGIAPVVGRAFTVNTGSDPFATDAAFDLAEQQVFDANAGLAVHVRDASVTPPTITGYWFDATTFNPTTSTAEYRLEGSATTLSRAALKLLVNSNTILLVQSTPVGSERRIASPTGVATPLSGSTPSLVNLEPLHAPTHWSNVDTLTGNAFVAWSGFVPPGSTPPGNGKARSLQTFEFYQTALAGFGVLNSPTHEAVRRLCVSGVNLRAGAVLELGVPLTLQPWTEAFTIKLPIFPTNRTNGEGRLIWETTAELDPLFAYQLLLGGPSAPGVLQAFNDTQPLNLPAGTFPFDAFTLAALWNKYRVVVRNEDGTANTAGPVQVLTID